MTTKRRLSRLAAVSAAALTITGLTGGLPAQAAQTTNTDPSFLVVYDNNTENMIPASCEKNDFEKLFAYIAAQPKSPDVFTVQQISNQKSLDALTDRMTAKLPGTYKGVIAIADPNHTDRGDPKDVCNKNQQTNAVIYRSDRLTAGATVTWRSDAPTDKKNGPCRNLTASGFQERVENVAVRLTDTVAHKDVTVASFHWPTSDPWNGPACSEENISEAQDRTASLGSVALTLLGGDANADPTAPSGSGNWSDKAKGYGFQDAMVEACAATGCTPPPTWKTHRFDYLLAKRGSSGQSGPGFNNAITISQAAAGGRYSDHLALRADAKY